MTARATTSRASENVIRVIHTQSKGKSQLKNQMVRLVNGVSKMPYGPFMTPNRSVTQYFTRRIRCTMNIVTSYQSIFLMPL